MFCKSFDCPAELRGRVETSLYKKAQAVTRVTIQLNQRIRLSATSDSTRAQEQFVDLPDVNF